MLHAEADGTTDGIAAPWAVQAQEGDRMSIFGPGGATFVNTDADWYLLTADTTALPALTASLGRLPATAKGYVIVEILAEENRQDLPAPASMDVVWVVNPQAGSEAAPLHDAVTRLAWRDGRVSVWAACEFKTVRKLRRYFRDERGVEKSHVYVSSYWKKGLKEEAHKVAKREDAT